MQKSKRNHWVSQSYLRAFAADPERREKIWRLSKNAGDAELKPIEKVAVKFHLYTPKGDDGERDYSFERKLADLENWFGDPLWSKLCNDVVDLQWEPLRKMVSLLVAVMHLRNPAQFEKWKAMHRQSVKALSALPEIPGAVEHKGKVYKLDKDTWPAYRDASENDLQRMWLKEVGQAVWVAEIMMKMRWAVLFSEEAVFITSDNPVTFLHPSLGFRGISNPETAVIFPLSPTRVLHMDNRHGEPDGEYCPLKHPASVTNGLLWRAANEHMFSHRDPNIVCAEMLLDEERQGYAR
jgi:hypothetical protein